MKTKLPFFNSLLPSFCETCEQNYIYKFFLGYDYNDEFLASNENRSEFMKHFQDIVDLKCSDSCHPHIELVKCNHTGQPSTAQNVALMQAYRENMDYLYNVNDDTRLITKNWTQYLIAALQKMYPPNVGCVGPYLFRGGGTRIITYHFVHRTHIDIFSFFRPSYFTDWGACNWLNDIYKENNVRQIGSVEVIHTYEKGSRYKVRAPKSWQAVLKEEVKKGREVLKSYLEKKNVNTTQWFSNQINFF